MEMPPVAITPQEQMKKDEEGESSSDELPDVKL